MKCILTDKYQFLGTCPGDKVQSDLDMELDDPDYCSCKNGLIEVLDDKCVKCVFDDKEPDEDNGEIACDCKLDLQFLTQCKEKAKLL